MPVFISNCFFDRKQMPTTLWFRRRFSLESRRAGTTMKKSVISGLNPDIWQACKIINTEAFSRAFQPFLSENNLWKYVRFTLTTISIFQIRWNYHWEWDLLDYFLSFFILSSRIKYSVWKQSENIATYFSCNVSKDKSLFKTIFAHYLFYLSTGFQLWLFCLHSLWQIKQHWI